MVTQTGGRSFDVDEGVYRATDEFPAGPECDLTCADVPDDESGFTTSDHYEQMRATRRDPHITDDVIEMLLTDSEVREAPGFDDRYLFQAEQSADGRDYEWTLVVAEDEDRDNRFALVTVYSNYHGSVGTTNKYFDRYRQRTSGGGD